MEVGSGGEETAAALEGDVVGWPEEAADVAGAALSDVQQGIGELRYLKVDGTLEAVANVEYGKDAIIVHNIAAAGGRGAGTHLLRSIAQEARAYDDRYGVRLFATPDSAPYYERLGFEAQRPVGGELPYYLPPEKTKAFGTPSAVPSVARIDPNLIPKESEPMQVRPPGDTVSVSTGPFVPEQMLGKIRQFGLDVPLDDLTPTTAVGRETYAAAKTTEGLYIVNGEWTADRLALHNKIIASHFEGKTAVATGEKTTYFTAGGGASGKSAAVFSSAGGDVGLEELAARSDVVAIDPDRIKAMLPEYSTLRDAGDFYAASGVHEESSLIAKEVTAEAQRRGLSMIVDTTGSSSEFVQKLLTAKADGYEVQVTMFSTPTNEAIARSITRGDRSGRYVAIQALKNAHVGASQQLGIWKDIQSVKEWRVYDNSAGRELIAYGGGGRITVLDQGKWDAILAKANE